MKLIMDQILNHCGSEHWFVKDPPVRDWVNFSGAPFTGTNHRRQSLQDPYASEWDRRHFTDGWFVPTMPDLNQRNPHLAAYLIQNSIWWIEYARLGGIRMDTYSYPDKEFSARWTCAIMNEYPDFNIVGEEWSEQPATIAYWQQDKDNPDGYRTCLPGLMDFPLQIALKNALTGEEGRWFSAMQQLYETLALDFIYSDPANLVIFPDNHDMDRIHTQLGGDAALTRMALAYVLTMRGIPQLYYGTEILMENDSAPGDHGVIRTDFPGGWAGDEVNAFSGKGLSEEQRATQEHLRRLLNWRKTADVIHRGRLMQFSAEQGCYVYFRYDDWNRVMVVLNKNDRPTELATDRFRELLRGTTNGTDVASGTRYDLREIMTVPAKTALILELN